MIIIRGSLQNHIDNQGNLLHELEIVYDDNRYDSYDDGWSGYTSEELEEMYRDAMGGDPTNEWNID